MLPPLQKVNVAGGEIAYRESGARDAQTVVLLHGIGSTSTGWREQYGPLGASFRVIGWNAPGYLGSTPLPAAKPTAEDYAKSLAGLLDALGASQVHLVSNSWGTLPSLAFADLFPQRAGAIVLGGPTAGYGTLPPAEQESKAAARAERIRTLGAQAMREQDAPHLVAPGTPGDVLRFVAGAGAELTVEGYAQAARMLFATDALRTIARLQKDILILSGELDGITPPRTNALRLAAANPRARLQMMPDCGHLPHLEYPQRFNAAVIAFIAGSTAKPA